MEEDGAIVSVIMPTYNRREIIQEAIDSVLAQTFQDFELIVVDDGSTDGTAEMLRTLYGGRIIYLWQENKGGPAARNLGLSVAKGKYIAFLDSDDLWFPEKLSRQVPQLDKNPDVAVVACQAWRIDAKGKKIGEVPLGIYTTSADFTVENLLMFNKIPAGPSTCLVRRSALDQVGGFSDDIRWGAEWDLWLRIATDAKLLMLPEPLNFYRRLKDSLSFFSTLEQVDHALADRLTIVQRCAEKYPNKISQRYLKKAMANQYVRAGLQSFLLKASENGKEMLSKALELCPDFWKNKEDFSERMTVFALSYSIDQASNFSPKLALSFADLLCASLPDALNRRSWISLIQGSIRREVGFYQYKNGERLVGLLLILNAICWAPQLLDLAVLAVFAELFVGRQVVDKLRLLRHKKPINLHENPEH